MAKKQLDFNAPLLSVRKISSSSSSHERTNKNMVEKAPPGRQKTLAVKKSDWELSEVTKPVAVPFMWEQIPGRPKGENEARANLRVERASSPRLPPGRTPEMVRFYSGERPRSQNIYKSQAEGLPWIDHAALLDSLAESIYARGKSDRDSLDDAYSDALETMSPTESLSLNCSISGLSGHQSSDWKPSGTFSVDSQTRDFMMNRFLPAAKAVVLETPQYIPKKQQPVIDQPKPVKMLVPVQKKPFLKPCESNPVPYYSSYPEDIGSDNEDKMSENQHKRPSKAWKFFPRICVKNSLCLLNPVPGLKINTHAPTPLAQEVKRASRMKSYSGPLEKVLSKVWTTKTVHTPPSYPHDLKRLTRKAYSGPLEKNACETINRQRFHSGVLSRDLYKAESRSLSGQLSYPKDSCKLVGISPSRHSRSGAVSPYRNVAPPSPFNDGAKFLGVPKEVESLRPNRFDSFRKGCNNVTDKPPHGMGKGGSESPSVAVEKTLYIDSIDYAKISVPNAASSKPKGFVKSSDKNMKAQPSPYAASSKPKGPVNTSDKNRKTLLGSSKVAENLAAKSRTQGAKKLDISEKGNKPKTLDLVEASPLDISRVRDPADQQSLEPNQKLDPVSVALESSKVHPYAKLGTKNEDNENRNDPTLSNLTTLQSPLPPPLPKSPSESWLWRTLPSIPLRTPFLSFNSKKPNQKSLTNGTKWETIVKTSNLHNDQVRYSEELYPRGGCQRNKA